MPVAHAIRMAVSLPLFVQPVMLDGLSWCDGGIADDLVCVDTPRGFFAIGEFYARFPQVSDDEVIGRLERPAAGVPAVTPTMPAPMLAGWPDTGTARDTRLPATGTGLAPDSGIVDRRAWHRWHLYAWPGSGIHTK